jgi:indolepyruvate ferredoxin oxidoreductase, alpha subunit
MSELWKAAQGERRLLMGNEAIARGAMEAGVSIAAGYPGTPSSEIIETLARGSGDRKIYVEWSVNEKVALEVAAAGSFSGLRSMAVMKQVGMNVASDFLLHLAQYGTRGGMVLVSCEDPGALSSTNEGESRSYARMMEVPLLEPADFQEAKDMTAWAFDLSEEIRNVVMLRSVTRLSHASGNVVLGELPPIRGEAVFHHDGPFQDTLRGPIVNLPSSVVLTLHAQQQQKLETVSAVFERSTFNRYEGPERPELLIITASICTLYCREAVRILGVEDRVGILKLGTTWPLPARLLEKHLSAADRILIVEEVLPFLEQNVLSLAAVLSSRIGSKQFHGKHDRSVPSVNEMNPDIVLSALSSILKKPYQPVAGSYREKASEIAKAGAPARALTFCPGCPHRASFWSIHNALQLDNRGGFVCGDIGCYSLGAISCGFDTLKTIHSMGSGTGLASGFGKLGNYGLEKPILSVCGDSTFYHAVMPALVNAVHNRSNILLVVLDNKGTAMTGFQAHPGLEVNAVGQAVPAVDIPEICRAMGATVEVSDPFDLEGTEARLLGMLEKDGVKVLVLRQSCALSPERKRGKRYEVKVDEELCLGEACGCSRICTRVFRCPGLIWDDAKRAAQIDSVICAGCGVCGSVCPAGAIEKQEAPS